MKRTITFFLAVALLFGGLILPVQTRAATSSSKAGVVTTAEGELNVRSGASTNTPIISTLHKGSYVTLLSKSGSWWQVEYAKGRYGYCHADYITVVEGVPATVTTKEDPLNVRRGPGTSYTIAAMLAKGETVIRLTTANGWSRILYHGTKTGYVSAQYLSGSQSDNHSISLQVPSFKQTDSRWANVKIGTSGKTIAQIGCATTGIAMMESYRTGTVIYPDAMAKKLNYTATGSVYWPSNFVPVTSSSGYLSAIHALLQQGKPVLLGARNSYGGQHWVVVTGFSGGSLIPSNFTVQDPGSNSRINLQQFLNVYPTFYKYFYYR